MLPEKSLRPSQRVEQFLREYLESHSLSSGDRLPSTRDIATRIGISEGTVRNVIRRWQNEGRLDSRHGSGVYLRNSPIKKYPFRIGANIRNNADITAETWQGGILTAMLSTLVELGTKASFTSLYSTSEEIDALSDGEVEARCRSLDGMILFQGDPHLPAILNSCRSHGKPVVTLNALDDESTANFVTAGNYSACHRVGRVLSQCGRKRMALFVYPDVQVVPSMARRLAGLANGIGAELGRSINLRVVTCRGMRAEDGKEALRRLMDEEGYQPDALLFSGDPHALGALDLLRERGISVPGEISVISGAGVYPEIHTQHITSLHHPIFEMGKTLVSMLSQMLESRTLELPGRSLPMGFIEGNTTTKAENKRLKESFERQ